MTKSLIAAAALFLAAAVAGTSAQAAPPVKNVVLVHGGFVDGSGWKGVYDILKKDGYNVAIVQNPTVSLKDDVAVTKRAIAQFDGPVVLVGHSYGGVVISEAGTDEKVKSLVYIAAFAPDKGESIQTLIANPPECLYVYEGLSCRSHRPPAAEIAPVCGELHDRLELEPVASYRFSSRVYDEMNAGRMYTGPDGASAIEQRLKPAEEIPLVLYRAHRKSS